MNHSNHMETKAKAPATLAALGALAVGAWLLSDKVQVSRGDAPVVSVDRTLDVQLPVGKTIVAATALAAGAILLSRLWQRPGRSYADSWVEESIVLNVPVSTAYNQWTQFEQFPRFMQSVDEVRQVDDTHLHWRATVAGQPKEWDSEITEQIPDQRIAWRSTSGVKSTGVVTFDKIGENRTRVMLQMDYEPQTTGEKIGAAIGGAKLMARGNLKRFKHLIEQRGVETGAWRGTVAPH